MLMMGEIVYYLSLDGYLRTIKPFSHFEITWKTPNSSKKEKITVTGRKINHL